MTPTLLIKLVRKFHNFKLEMSCLYTNASLIWTQNDVLRNYNPFVHTYNCTQVTVLSHFLLLTQITHASSEKLISRSNDLHDAAPAEHNNAEQHRGVAVETCLVMRAAAGGRGEAMGETTAHKAIRPQTLLSCHHVRCGSIVSNMYDLHIESMLTSERETQQKKKKTGPQFNSII